MRLLDIFFRVRDWLVHGKMWMQRSMSWITLFNSGMIIFLVLSKLQDYGMKIYITGWFIPIFIAFVFLLLLFGYIEDKTGFHREETRAITKRNPYFKEILERLDRIEKKLGEK